MDQLLREGRRELGEMLSSRWRLRARAASPVASRIMLFQTNIRAGENSTMLQCTYIYIYNSWEFLLTPQNTVPISIYICIAEVLHRLAAPRKKHADGSDYRIIGMPSTLMEST